MTKTPQYLTKYFDCTPVSEKCLNITNIPYDRDGFNWISAVTMVIRIEATTVGNNDLDALYGRWESLPVPAPFVPSQEVSRTIVEAGAKVQSRMGKHVISMPHGYYRGFADFVVRPGTMTFEVSLDMSVCQVVAIF